MYLGTQVSTLAMRSFSFFSESAALHPPTIAWCLIQRLELQEEGHDDGANLHNARNDTSRGLQVDIADEEHDGLEHKFHHQQPGCGPQLLQKLDVHFVVRQNERFAQSVIVRHDARLNTCYRNLQSTCVKN